MGKLKLCLGLVALVAVAFCCCPVVTSGDSCWMVPVATQILERESTAIDTYEGYRQAHLGCPTEMGVDGHRYAAYPVAVAVSAVPELALFRGALSGLRQVLPIPTANPILQEFFAGRLDGSAHAVAEMLIASIQMALAAGVMFLIASEFLPLQGAILLTLLFAFATPVWSNASRAMWNQTPALLFFTMAIYCFVRARRDARFVIWASVPLEAAFFARPSMAIPCVVLTVFVAVRHRQYFWRYCAVALPLAVAFAAYNLRTRGHFFQPYFTETMIWPPAPWLERFGLQLVSPSRGLFIFCPLTLFSFAGMWMAWRERWMPVAPWLIALVFVQVLLVTKYFWPGFAYGPRYFTEFLPVFCLFLIPVLLRISKWAAGWRVFFLLACGWSFFVQLRGATAIAVHHWNETPISVDVARGRVWDWRDPQFLR